MVEKDAGASPHRHSSALAWSRFSRRAALEGKPAAEDKLGEASEGAARRPTRIHRASRSAPPSHEARGSSRSCRVFPKRASLRLHLAPCSLPSDIPPPPCPSACRRFSQSATFVAAGVRDAPASSSRARTYTGARCDEVRSRSEGGTRARKGEWASKAAGGGGRGGIIKKTTLERCAAMRERDGTK